MNHKINLFIILFLFMGAVLLFSPGLTRLTASNDPFCITHQIAEKDCPWCDPGIIEKHGHCKEHGVPEALCSQCNPDLIAGFKAESDWCAGHAVPESQCELCGGSCGAAVPDEPQIEETAAEESSDCPHSVSDSICPFCHPELKETLGFCHGHGVPEAVCTRCNPLVIPAFKAMGDWCAGHEIPESQCTLCNPELLEKTIASGTDDLSVENETGTVPRIFQKPEVRCRKHTSQIRFESPEISRAAGLETTTVVQMPVTLRVQCFSEISYHGSWHSEIASRAPGVLHKILKEPGQHVEKGETLALVDSSELGTASAEYLQAKTLVNLWEKNYGREEKLKNRGFASGQDVLEAETRLTESRIAFSRATRKLQNLGLTRDQIGSIQDLNNISSQLPVKAPFAGIVTRRSASQGELVDPQFPIFTIADTSVMWLNLEVNESEISRIRQDQPVIFRPQSMPGQQWPGKVMWVSTMLDSKTRTLKVRAEVDNPDGLLRAGMFGRSEIMVRNHENALMVPSEAVQWEGCCNVVFIKRSDQHYEPRKIHLGFETDGYYIVEDGVHEGEEIVTTGSFLLKTEILKGSIGAGCCEVSPGKDG